VYIFIYKLYKTHIVRAKIHAAAYYLRRTTD